MKVATAAQASQALRAINELFDYFEYQVQLEEPTLSLVKGQLHNFHTYVFKLSECQTYMDQEANTAQAAEG